MNPPAHNLQRSECRSTPKPESPWINLEGAASAPLHARGRDCIPMRRKTLFHFFRLRRFDEPFHEVGSRDKGYSFAREVQRATFWGLRMYLDTPVGLTRAGHKPIIILRYPAAVFPGPQSAPRPRRPLRGDGGGAALPRSHKRARRGCAAPVSRTDGGMTGANSFDDIGRFAA